MSLRSDVSPSTLRVEITDDDVIVTYLDGREAIYRTPRKKVASSVRCQPGKEVHILVTNAAETEGVLVYVNDRRTDAEILEATGVGRVMLEPGTKTEVFPGIQVEIDGHAIIVTADHDVVDGRIFVFEEDELRERAFELREE